MKITSDEPFIVSYLKALAIVAFLFGVLAVITGGGEAVVRAVISTLGIAPLIWWMASIVSLLHRIAKASEARADLRAAHPASVGPMIPSPATSDSPA